MNTRREFLADVGRGMLIGTLGASMAVDLGLSKAIAGEDSELLLFGEMEPLVAQMQETPPDRLVRELVTKIQSGTPLNTLVAAATLANARTFGGQDYIGFHTLMALPPAYAMSRELPSSHRALPVLKVLYRNSERIQDFGGRSKEVLHRVQPVEVAQQLSGEQLREATRRADWNTAERNFAAMTNGPIGEAYNHLQFAVQDEVDVHRVVLAWRAWAVLDITGMEHAHTLLRQSVRYCVQREQERLERKRPEPLIRSVLPKLLDQYRLLSRSAGNRKADAAWIEQLSKVIYGSNRETAADAVAAALAEGFSYEDVGEALSLAANLLVLRDPGRPKEHSSNKPVGSVHGDSVGVHASDAANAWRNIARASNRRNAVASLITGAFHTAGQSHRAHQEPYPQGEALAKIHTSDAATLLRETEEAIRSNDQSRASALVSRYGQLGHSTRPVFDLMLRFATSQDGALHAEKYYHTVTEEFGKARPEFRWRHLIALARVTASEYGWKAPGYAEACQLLKVEV